MLRVGVIGCGYWGPNLVRAFSECDGATVRAVSDQDPSRLDRIQLRYPSVETHLHARDLIARCDLDLVVIATRVDSHFELAQAAIEAGRHVLVEKPFTQTSEEARELIDLADRKGVLLAVDHTFLFTPAVEKIKALIDEGHLGTVNYIDSVRINLGLIQEEANVVWDLAPHDLAIIDYLVGRTPRRVIATGARRMVIYDDMSTSEKIRVYDTGATAVAMGVPGSDNKKLRVDYRVGDIWTPYLPPVEALAAQAAHLVSAIENGTPLRADGKSGLRVVRVLEACTQSLREDGIRVLMAEPIAQKPVGEVTTISRKRRDEVFPEESILGSHSLG